MLDCILVWEAKFFIIYYELKSGNLTKCLAGGVFLSFVMVIFVSGRFFSCVMVLISSELFCQSLASPSFFLEVLLSLIPSKLNLVYCYDSLTPSENFLCVKDSAMKVWRPFSYSRLFDRSCSSLPVSASNVSLLCKKATFACNVSVWYKLISASSAKVYLLSSLSSVSLFFSLLDKWN